jgi:hypothetical protein
MSTGTDVVPLPETQKRFAKMPDRRHHLCLCARAATFHVKPAAVPLILLSLLSHQGQWSPHPDRRLVACQLDEP